MDLTQKVLQTELNWCDGFLYVAGGKQESLIWYCCGDRRSRHDPQNNDTSGWIQQAEKMCLLTSDRADAAPSSQLMLLLPSVSISAADWADMLLNFLPGTRVLSLWALWMNIGSARLASSCLLTGSWGCPLTPVISALFSISYTQHAQDWASNRG